MPLRRSLSNDFNPSEMGSPNLRQQVRSAAEERRVRDNRRSGHRPGRQPLRRIAGRTARFAHGRLRSGIYAVTCRGLRNGPRWRLESWENELAVGSALPTLPIWVAPDLMFPLELEATYEETCWSLRIG